MNIPIGVPGFAEKRIKRSKGAQLGMGAVRMGLNVAKGAKVANQTANVVSKVKNVDNIQKMNKFRQLGRGGEEAVAKDTGWKKNIEQLVSTIDSTKRVLLKNWGRAFQGRFPVNKTVVITLSVAHNSGLQPVNEGVALPRALP
jgi:hypothetical protein